VNDATPQQSPDDAVRRFLQFLADPTIARDDRLIAELRGKLAGETDLLERLRLIQAAQDAELADGSAIRAGFVRHAKNWAGANGISVAAFRELGVSDIALAEAGFDLGFGRGRPGAKGAKNSRAVAAGKPRAASVSSEDIRTWVTAQDAPFTLNKIMENVGGSLGTVNKVVDDLITSSKVRNLGKDPGHKGRGRAPFLYERTGS
jgi:hypothetical protein